MLPIAEFNPHTQSHPKSGPRPGLPELIVPTKTNGLPPPSCGQTKVQVARDRLCPPVQSHRPVSRVFFTPLWRLSCACDGLSPFVGFIFYLPVC